MSRGGTNRPARPGRMGVRSGAPGKPLPPDTGYGPGRWPPPSSAFLGPARRFRGPAGPGARQAVGPAGSFGRPQAGQAPSWRRAASR